LQITFNEKDMRKIIAAINLTLDGFCDHTAITPDEEVHDHYTDLLTGADAILYGRITYQLMQYWQPFLENPSGEKSMDDFALSMDKVPKIVFSHTLKETGWDSAQLSDQSVEATVLRLREEPGKDVLVGSRSIIIQLMNLNLIDEYQFCVHPVVAGSGLPLFENVTDRTVLKLTKTKIFDGGAVILYYGRNND